MDANSTGHSLQELLITLGVLSALYMAAVPALRTGGPATEASRATQAISRALAQARVLAIGSGERVTICGSPNGSRCAREWGEGVELLVFTDRDNNRVLSKPDALHLQQPLPLQHGRVVWRLSLGRPYLRYRVGGTAVEYGRISYCPSSGKDRDFRQLVINHVGRVYQHRDGSGRRKHCDA